MTAAPNSSTHTLHTLIIFGVQVMAIWITDQLLGSVHISSFWHTVVLAAVIGLLNHFVKPLLIVLTIPVTLFTLGLFLLIINGAIIALAAEIVPGFEVRSFGAAVWFSIVLSVISWALESLFGLRREDVRIRRGNF